MPWVINEAGESVWQDPNQAINDWAAQYYDAENGTFNIPGVGVVNVASPWADFQKSSAFGSGSTPGAFRSNMFEGGGQVIDTPYGQLFVGKSRQDAPEMSAEPGAGFGGMLPLMLASGIGAAGAAAGFGLGGLGSAAGGAGTGAGASGALAGDFASSFAPTLTEAGLSTAANQALIPTLGEIAGTSSLGLPAGGWEAVLGTSGAAGAGGTAGLDQILSGYNPMGDYGEYGGYTSANTVPTGTAAAGAGANTAASTLSQFLKDKFGLDINPSTLGMLGTGLNTALGMWSANQQGNRLESIADRTAAERAPFLGAATGMLNNPSSYFQGPVAQELARSMSSALSADFGNPALSPTAQAKMIQGLAPSYYNTISQLGSLGLGGQGITAGLGTQAAQAQGQPWAVLGSGIENLTNNQNNGDLSQLLSKVLRNQYGQLGGLA